MKISVIIPVYNMANTLEECIHSIMIQDYDDFEIVLVDDGSKDDSLEICQRFEKEYDRVHVYHQENQGSGPARNTGIHYASGDYYLFIDSDDRLEKTALRCLANYVQNSEPDLIVFGYVVQKRDGSARKKLYSERMLTGESIRSDYCPFFSSTFEWGIQGAPWNKLFRAEVVRRYGVEYPALRRHQDEVFISRFVNHAETVLFIEDCLYLHRANDIKLIWKKYPKDYAEIVHKLYLYRNEVILPWGKSKEIEALIYSEYVNNMIRACFRAIDDMTCQTYRDRKTYYRQVLSNMEFKSCKYPKKYIPLKKSIQNHLFCLCGKVGLYRGVDFVIKARTANNQPI